MNVILVDDESLALEYLEQLLNNIGGLNIIGKYTNPAEAKSSILREKPSIVFLDIEMPGLNGIELAENILQSLPKTHIVFVTAFNDYAVKAFELNAIDYLVKPVQQNRLARTLQRLSINIKNERSSAPSTKVDRICVFQSLSFTRTIETTELLEVKWRTSKARGIFTFLLQHRNKYINVDTLLDIFWPDIEREKGIAQLYSAIYQIRKTLSAIELNISITKHEHGYLLQLNDVELDSGEWEAGLMKYSKVDENTVQSHRRLINIYQGDYLSDDGYLWAENERERLRILWIEHLTKVADYLASKNEYSEAISIYLKLQMTVPYMDFSYVKLMRLYASVRNLHAVEQQYLQLKEMLLDEYGIEPKLEIRKWYMDWLKSVAIGD